MAGNPNCLVYNMYIVKTHYLTTGNTYDHSFNSLSDAHRFISYDFVYNKLFQINQRFVKYSLTYRKDDTVMTTKDLLDYLDARLREAKQRYDQSERDIVLGEINAINYIYKYITDNTYRRIANDYYNVGGGTK